MSSLIEADIVVSKVVQKLKVKDKQRKRVQYTITQNILYMHKWYKQIWM